MYVCMYVCMYVRMDGWMDGWMDAMYVGACVYVNDMFAWLLACLLAWFGLLWFG